MREIRTSGSMSGDGKRGDASIVPAPSLDSTENKGSQDTMPEKNQTYSSSVSTFTSNRALFCRKMQILNDSLAGPFGFSRISSCTMQRASRDLYPCSAMCYFERTAAILAAPVPAGSRRHASNEDTALCSGSFPEADRKSRGPTRQVRATFVDRVAARVARRVFVLVRFSLKGGKSCGPTRQVRTTLLDGVAASAHSSPVFTARRSHHIAVAGTFFLGAWASSQSQPLSVRNHRLRVGVDFLPANACSRILSQAHHRIEFFHVDFFGEAPDAPIRVLPSEERIQQLTVGMIDGKVLKRWRNAIPRGLGRRLGALHHFLAKHGLSLAGPFFRQERPRPGFVGFPLGFFDFGRQALGDGLGDGAGVHRREQAEADENEVFEGDSRPQSGCLKVCRSYRWRWS